jgi:hypothetical protein
MPARAAEPNATDGADHRVQLLHLIVDDLDTEIGRLRAEGLSFGSDPASSRAGLRSCSPTPPAT